MGAGVGAKGDERVVSCEAKLRAARMRLEVSENSLQCRVPENPPDSEVAFDGVEALCYVDAGPPVNEAKTWALLHLQVCRL